MVAVVLEAVFHQAAATGRHMGHGVRHNSRELNVPTFAPFILQSIFFEKRHLKQRNVATVREYGTHQSREQQDEGIPGEPVTG
jgi:hypothetical protein